MLRKDQLESDIMSAILAEAGNAALYNALRGRQQDGSRGDAHDQSKDRWTGHYQSGF